MCAYFYLQIDGLFNLITSLPTLRTLTSTIGQCTCKRNIEARLRNHFYTGTALSITYSECGSAFMS
jgi:hypothetical protein